MRHVVVMCTAIVKWWSHSFGVARSKDTRVAQHFKTNYSTEFPVIQHY